MTIWEDEERKAILYRQQWESRIQFRQNLIRRLQGQSGAFQLLWENWRVPYDPTNYIAEAPLEEGSYITPFELDQNGQISSTTIRLAGVRHAGDENDHPYD